MKKIISALTLLTAVMLAGGSIEAKTVSKKKHKSKAAKTAVKKTAKQAASSTRQDSIWIETPSGLKYRILREGTGISPTETDKVNVNYEGRLPDGTIFDSSYQRGEAISFPLNRVIKGWTEGLQLMKEGAKYEFFIPSDLAYGQRGTPGGPIGPNQDLIFVVELLKVEK